MWGLWLPVHHEITGGSRLQQKQLHGKWEQGREGYSPHPVAEGTSDSDQAGESTLPFQGDEVLICVLLKPQWIHPQTHPMGKDMICTEP